MRTEPLRLKPVPCPPALREMLEARGAGSIRAHRSDSGLMTLTAEEPFLPGGRPGTHISISRPDRDPACEEQRDAVWELAPARIMAMFLPPCGLFGTLPGSHVFHWFEVPAGVDTSYAAGLKDWL